MITEGTIKNQFPQHFEEMYPRFIKFVAAYYDWLYSQDSRGGVVESAGTIDSFLRSTHLDRGNDTFVTLDEYVFSDSDEREFSATTYNEESNSQWLTQLGFRPAELYLDTVYDGATNPSKLDIISLIKILNDIWKLRGTQKGTEILFHMFFNETVTVLYPRALLASPDGGLICDDYVGSVVRDDEFWNEYSIVVVVLDDTKYYEEFINLIYTPHFHPSGFKLILETKIDGVDEGLSSNDILHHLIHTTLPADMG
ncbi:MAG: hypothetical protein KAS32_23425 [Candidatus Peribacteraceae bacterium]|nr:hypothetical protein [Candidatus Peribacteraceae bacterium]